MIGEVVHTTLCRAIRGNYQIYAVQQAPGFIRNCVQLIALTRSEGIWIERPPIHVQAHLSARPNDSPWPLASMRSTHRASAKRTVADEVARSGQTSLSALYRYFVFLWVILDTAARYLSAKPLKHEEFGQMSRV